MVGVVDDFALVGVSGPSTASDAAVEVAYPFVVVVVASVELGLTPACCGRGSLCLFVTDTVVTDEVPFAVTAAAAILFANSCAFCMGGGRKEDEGDGKGEVEGGDSIDRVKWGKSAYDFFSSQFRNVSIRYAPLLARRSTTLLRSGLDDAAGLDTMTEVISAETGSFHLGSRARKDKDKRKAK